MPLIDRINPKDLTPTMREGFIAWSMDTFGDNILPTVRGLWFAEWGTSAGRDVEAYVEVDRDAAGAIATVTLGAKAQTPMPHWLEAMGRDVT